MATASDRCAICAHPISGPQCPHPWNQPFSTWPQQLLTQLKSVLRDGRHPGS